MSPKLAAIADIQSVIDEDPVEVTGAASFRARSGAVSEQSEFTVGNVLFVTDRTLLCVASDVVAVASKSKLAIDGAQYRVYQKQIDELGAGAILTLGSPAK